MICIFLQSYFLRLFVPLNSLKSFLKFPDLSHINIGKGKGRNEFELFYILENVYWAYYFDEKYIFGVFSG